MKTSTRLFLAFSSALLLTGSMVTAQSWCSIPTGSYPCTCINTYLASSPVITNVTLNTINRTSLTTAKELFINTMTSTTLTVGQSYAFSMTFSTDVAICADYNLKVYVDWNIDGDFADAGEAALTRAMNGLSAASATYTATLTVPGTATAGATRMRVCMKMGATGGHTPIDPCLVTETNNLGWHGEVEDYTLVLASGGSGIVELNDAASVSVYPNPVSGSATVSITGGTNLSDRHFVVYDVLGKEAIKMNIPNGVKEFNFDKGALTPGLYFYSIVSEKNTVGTGKLVIR